MGYLGARHLILPLLAIVLIIEDCSGLSTYDQLVAQLRPQLRGGGGGRVPPRLPRPPRRPSYRPRPRPKAQKPGKGTNGTTGRHISVGTQTSSTSTDVKEFEGIYEDGAPNMTAEAIYSEKQNTLSPTVSILGINLGADIKFGQTKEQTISLGGHPAENSSSSGNWVSVQPTGILGPASSAGSNPLSWIPPPNPNKDIFGFPKGSFLGIPTGNIFGFWG